MAVYTGKAIIVANGHPIPEYHPETELVRVIAGNVVIQLDGTARTFREGDIFLIPAIPFTATGLHRKIPSCAP